MLILFHGGLFNHKTKSLQPLVINQSNKQFKTIIKNKIHFYTRAEMTTTVLVEPHISLQETTYK